MRNSVGEAVFGSPTAPVRGTWVRQARVPGFAKNAHPWLSSSRSGAQKQTFASAAAAQQMYKLQGMAGTAKGAFA